MTTMSDSEVLAAIDRGMRRVWAKFPQSDEPTSEKAGGSFGLGVEEPAVLPPTPVAPTRGAG